MNGEVGFFEAGKEVGKFILGLKSNPELEAGDIAIVAAMLATMLVVGHKSQAAEIQRLFSQRLANENKDNQD